RPARRSRPWQPRGNPERRRRRGPHRAAAAASRALAAGCWPTWPAAMRSQCAPTLSACHGTRRSLTRAILRPEDHGACQRRLAVVLVLVERDLTGLIGGIGWIRLERH